MKFLRAPFVVCMILAAFLAGCGGPNTATVGLNVELTRITQTGGGPVQVTWRVLNPNIVPYLISRTTHRVYLDGVLIGTVDDRDALAIPAQTNQERTTALSSAGPAADRAIAAAATAGTATYRMESAVIVRLYGDNTEKSELRGGGKVPVTSK